jgi:hypothetical protein
MSLLADLARVKTEEDVKDAYIKALGLKPKDYSKGLVDIRTASVWFEAKGGPTAPLIMFAQLIVYIRGARLRGEPVPAFLAVIDSEKGAILATERALPALDDDTIVWPVSGSQAGKELAAQLAPYIDRHFTTYPVATLADEFCDAIKGAIRDNAIIKTPITPDNLRQVFDKWVAMIGRELDVAETDFSTLFFADIMFDEAVGEASYGSIGAHLVTLDRKPAFILLGSKAGPLRVSNVRAYNNFWSIYLRPPEQHHRRWLYERRELLFPLDQIRFQGEFYTPLHIVDKAYAQLLATLGEGWQDRYIVWDMCCGIGNLETKHSNPRDVFMSTLLERDIDIMRENNICLGAEMFQYDYLNDDITDFGEIDYNLTNKVPMALRQAIADAKAGIEGAKSILVLINPPYAEATNDNTGQGVAQDSSGAKPKVAATKLAKFVAEHYGKASNELFTQFIVRIHKEMPHGILAIFSTLKYINAPTLEKFRQKWFAKFLSGFVVHSRAFDGVSGNFPIGFLIWDTAVQAPLSEISTRALNRDGHEVGVKNFGSEIGRKLLTDWINRPRANHKQVVPLKNALTPATATKDLRGTRWSEGALAYMWCNGNDLQQASKTALFSSGFNGGHGLYVNAENLWQAATVFTVRKVTPHTWQNHNDQFLQPSQPLTDEFKSDCLVWMLFEGKNLTAGADGLHWNDRDWSIVNHFIPFTEAEVGASGRFESDFMVRHMKGMTFSAEAQAVLDEGRKLWHRFHAINFPRKIRDELKLGRADAGWYQIRKSLEAYGETELTDFDPFKAAYAALGAKLRPMVFELGFLPK